MGDAKVDRVPDTRVRQLTPRRALEHDLPFLVPLSWSIQAAVAESRVWVLYTKQILISRSSEGWMSKIKAPADQLLGRILVLSHLATSSLGGGVRGSLGSLIPLMGAPPS